MKYNYYVIENSRIPVLLSVFIKINAITIGQYIFCRNKIDEKTLRHELVHVHQWRETLYIGFLFFYITDWIIGLIKCKNFRNAYLNIRMEKEARIAEIDHDYLSKNRKKYGWKDLNKEIIK